MVLVPAVAQAAAQIVAVVVSVARVVGIVWVGVAGVLVARSKMVV